MRKCEGTGFGAAKLPRPIDDILDPKKEQQGCHLDQYHPQI